MKSLLLTDGRFLNLDQVTLVTPKDGGGAKVDLTNGGTIHLSPKDYDNLLTKVVITKGMK